MLGAVIGGGSYAADCAVNKKRIRLDEMTVSVATGAFAGWLGGDGANKEKTLTNTIKIAEKKIERMKLRKCVSYVTKQNARTKAWRNNILSYSVLDGVIKFSAGTAISTHTASRWGQIRKNIKSILNNSFRW